MVLPLSCVNHGGPGSVVKLELVPQLDVDTPLSASALDALVCWQAKVDDVLTVLDPETSAYRARIGCLDPDGAVCVPFERMNALVESHLFIEVYLPVLADERFESALGTLTELGVNRIVPVASKQLATLTEGRSRHERVQRWSAVIRQASHQCRRAMLPELAPVQSFAEVLKSTSSTELKLMLCEGDATWTISEGLGSFKPHSVALLVAPDGGFSAQEIELAQAEAFLPVKLGARSLRAETSAVIAAALVQSHLGDLG